MFYDTFHTWNVLGPRTSAIYSYSDTGNIPTCDFKYQTVRMVVFWYANIIEQCFTKFKTPFIHSLKFTVNFETCVKNDAVNV